MNSRLLLAILLLAFTCSSAHAAGEPDQSARLPVKLLPTLAAPEKLTGDLSDPAWKSAAIFPLRNAFTGEPLPIQTTARAFATADSIYVGFSCDEPDIKSLSTSGPIWARDSVEVFIEPGMDLKSRPYHEIDIDSNGSTEFDLAHLYPYPKYFNLKCAAAPWTPKFDIATARTATGWTVELCIPINQLHIDEADKNANVWRMDFHRNRPGPARAPTMNWGWAPTGIKSYHMAGRFGIVLIDRDNMLSINDLNLPPATEADKQWLKPLDDAFKKQVADAAVALTSDPDPTQAIDRLETLARQNVGGALAVQQKIEPLIRTLPRPGDALNAAQKVISYCLMLPLQNDDDPPPPEIANQVDAFQPRTYRDAAGMTLPYRLLKPANFDPSKKYPALLFLHGSGELGADNRRQLADGSLIFSSKEYLEKYPCFVIAPQCPSSDSWVSSTPKRQENQQFAGFQYKEKPTDSLRMALEITDALQKEFPQIDPARLYVSGASLGGFGTYEAVYRRPDLFAAAAPIAAESDPDIAPLLSKTPFYIFHGARDERVKPQYALEMFTAIQKAGGNAGLLMYYDGSHGITPTDDSIYLNWLFAQHKTIEKPNP